MGGFVIWMAIITGLSSLLILYQPLPAPVGLTWSDIHFYLGIVLVLAMLTHFVVRRRACARKSTKAGL